MQLSKEMYGRKRIHIGCSVRIENSVTQDNYSASLGKPRGENSVTEFSIRSEQSIKIIIVLEVRVPAIKHLFLFIFFFFSDKVTSVVARL